MPFYKIVKTSPRFKDMSLDKNGILFQEQPIV